MNAHRGALCVNPRIKAILRHDYETEMTIVYIIALCNRPECCAGTLSIHMNIKATPVWQSMLGWLRSVTPDKLQQHAQPDSGM